MGDSEVLSGDFIRLRKNKNEADFAWRFILALIPILAGVDKFLGLLVNWDKFFGPLVKNVLPVSPHGLILVFGIAEIAAGIAVATRPRLFWYVLVVWAAAMAANLWLVQSYQGEWPFGKLLNIGE